MSKTIITSEEKSVYLDTSFIFNALNDSYDKEKKVTKNSQEILWLLFQYKIWNCYISNITINELFNTIEKQWYIAFIDNKIIKEIWLSKSDWKKLHKTQKDKYRNEKLGFNYYNIKSWRKDEHKDDYKTYVYNEFENIIDTLKGLEFITITNFENSSNYYDNFYQNIKKLNKLDASDLNHFLLCKEHNVSWIITCDSDFTQVKQVSDNNIEILHIDKSHKTY